MLWQRALNLYRRLSAYYWRCKEEKKVVMFYLVQTETKLSTLMEILYVKGHVLCMLFKLFDVLLARAKASDVAKDICKGKVSRQGRCISQMPFKKAFLVFTTCSVTKAETFCPRRRHSHVPKYAYCNQTIENSMHIKCPLWCQFGHFSKARSRNILLSYHHNNVVWGMTTNIFYIMTFVAMFTIRVVDNCCLQSITVSLCWILLHFMVILPPGSTKQIIHILRAICMTIALFSIYCCLA